MPRRLTFVWVCLDMCDSCSYRTCLRHSHLWTSILCCNIKHGNSIFISVPLAQYWYLSVSGSQVSGSTLDLITIVPHEIIVLVNELIIWNKQQYIEFLCKMIQVIMWHMLRQLNCMWEIRNWLDYCNHIWSNGSLIYETYTTNVETTNHQ